MKLIIQKIFGKCKYHGWFLYPRKFRTRTAYFDEKKNWDIGCKRCIKESNEYWDEMWKEYYHSIRG